MAARPANLPDALVLLAPVPTRASRTSCGRAPRRRPRRRAPSGAPGRGVDDLAVDVELELVARRRCRCAPAASPRSPEASQLELREAALACDAVHDLQVVRVAGDRAEEPVAPGAGLLDVAGSEEREQRQRRVAQPAVAVVPVADAADPLRQRRRRRGDDPAGRCVRERLQREQGATDGVVPLPVVLAPGRPVLPERHASPRAPPPASIRWEPARSTETSGGRTARGRPSATVKVAWVRRSRPSCSTGVRRSTASGPAIAMSVPSIVRAHGTMLP